MNKKLFPHAAAIGLFFGGALLLTATGCVSYVDRPQPGEVYVTPSVPVFIEQDDYVYYPQYRMYYGSRSHCYYRYEGRSWVAAPSPRGVAVNVLVSSPSVNVEFHDSPSAHHEQVIKTYPRNWQPSGDNHHRKEGRQNRPDGNGKDDDRKH